MSKHRPEDIEAAAQWLYRRYCPQPKPVWNLIGGSERGSWYGDAMGVLDAMGERQEEAGERPSMKEPPRPMDPQTASANADAGESRHRAGKVGPPARSPEPDRTAP